MPRKRIVLGSDYFPEQIAQDVLYIDKTLLIKAILEDSAKVILLTRPRRWGKTLNMSMLQHFFAAKVLGKETRGLFTGLKIAQESCMVHQGQYPVIFLTLKDSTGDSLDEVKSKIYQTICDLCTKYKPDIVKNMLKLEKAGVGVANFQAVVNNTASQAQYERALLNLSECLHVIYEKNVYILIDEYDAPLNHAYGKVYFEALVTFMRGFLTATLKGNSYLEKGVLTGIFRLAKANIFSGLNNVKEQTLLSRRYAPYFGFTHEEIIELANSSADSYFSCDLAELKGWYNGYQVGGVTLYNPWSIMSCISDAKIDIYWIETGNNAIIEKALLAADSAIKLKLQLLIMEEEVEVIIDKFTSFGYFGTESAFWSLLFNAGYLTLGQQMVQTPGQYYKCLVRIPNREVKIFYLQNIQRWLEKFSSVDRNSFMGALISCDIATFSRYLTEFLEQTFSFFDVGGRNAEQAYHTFILGLVADMMLHGYIVKSNRESGAGRYDVLLKPKDKSALAVIFEFKSIDDPQNLEVAATGALRQIHEKNYVSELVQEGISQRLLLGIAFAGKKLAIKYEKSLIRDFNPTLQSAKDKTPALLQGLRPPFDMKQLFGDLKDVEKSVTGVFEEHELQFDVYRTGGGGHCGFYSLPIPYDRAGVVALLMKHSDDLRVRTLVVPEIIANYQTGHMPAMLLDKYPVFRAFHELQIASDFEQQRILTQVLDVIDPERTKIAERSFANVLEFLTQQLPENQELVAKMQAFKVAYDAKLQEIRTALQSKEIFTDFVTEYIGKDGELSFATGGLNFTRETSLLDAILLVAEPPIRLCIWQEVPGEVGKVHVVYMSGNKEAPVSHVYHVRGQDTHFALMATSTPRFAKGDIRSFFLPTTKRARSEEADAAAKRPRI